jgi:succinyl-diaminopimelate desuccinylase
MAPPPELALPFGDLLALTAALVDVPSVSFDEDTLCSMIEAELRAVPWLSVERIGDNVVARTNLGRDRRVVFAGHTDTVPAKGNDVARLDGDRLWGCGAADMKGGLAVMLELARTVADPVVDATWVFYAREEVGAEHSGLAELFAADPALLAGDVAVLGEPTGAAVEAGCQGTLRLRIVLHGQRAHTARPWMGRNAIHRLAGMLDAIERYEPRRPVLEGCEFREALQAVRVEGGVAGNVVPDEATLEVNHRFAPDRSLDEAEAHVLEVLGDWLEEGDRAELTDGIAGAWPAAGDPVVAALVARQGLSVTAKLGWTDTARFSAAGIPAINYGPGESTVAHMADEYLDRAPLEAVHAGLLDLLTNPVT